MERSVKGMLPWQQLSGVEKALRSFTTLFAKERGLLWSVISRRRCHQHGSKRAGDALAWLRNIDYLVPNRFEDGYGLSPE